MYGGGLGEVGGSVGMKFSKRDRHLFFFFKKSLTHYGNEERNPMAIGGDRNNEKRHKA